MFCCMDVFKDMGELGGKAIGEFFGIGIGEFCGNDMELGIGEFCCMGELCFMDMGEF